jgi:HemK-like putative methylase
MDRRGDAHQTAAWLLARPGVKSAGNFKHMTILDVIQRSTDFLARKGVASPRLQVELLLAHLLRMPRMQLYLSFERALTAAELDALRALVQRRGQREPLQYIVGSTSFCGLEIALNRHVLIPRPETELLAQRAWTFLQKAAGIPSALEIGTGSGCLAIALAHHAPWNWRGGTPKPTKFPAVSNSAKAISSPPRLRTLALI